MWDIAEMFVDLLKHLVWSIFPPLLIEVHSLYYCDVGYYSDSTITVIDPYAPGYFGKISLTNRKDMAVYIKEVRLQVSGIILKGVNVRNLRLEPHERRTIQIIFPVDTGHRSHTDDSFVLTVKPTVGRHSKRAGTLPLNAPDSC